MVRNEQRQMLSFVVTNFSYPIHITLVLLSKGFNKEYH
jgi:hypothetical protein